MVLRLGQYMRHVELAFGTCFGRRAPSQRGVRSGAADFDTSRNFALLSSRICVSRVPGMAILGVRYGFGPYIRPGCRLVYSMTYSMGCTGLHGCAILLDIRWATNHSPASS
jgi:hypothetical protein